MKKKILLIFFISTLCLANIPRRVNSNIEKNSFTRDNANLYIRDQERAYNRILSLGKKEGLSEEKIDTEVKRLEKRYGADYEIIYKNFYYSVKELSKNEKKIVEAKKINEEKKEEYKELIKKSELPSEIRGYIEKEATNKYPDNYSERVKYSEELIKFYNFIKK
ncbi:hypothetical protein [Cetobacterium sp. ZWU0022]|uniref:hypothetical protein n=1 Tax=Cetobacterium sp. ZWU0022 TaxID=1340502 RepID=UPI0006475733|nr:hypothetical protein [Cetobacterium sp. ZWU0022]